MYGILSPSQRSNNMLTKKLVLKPLMTMKFTLPSTECSMITKSCCVMIGFTSFTITLILDCLNFNNRKKVRLSFFRYRKECGCGKFKEVASFDELGQDGGFLSSENIE